MTQKEYQKQLYKINIHTHSLMLHAFGTIYWERHQMLFIADVHLGKVSHFRKHGSAVPTQAITENFKRLDTVISCFQPKIVCFLGDLFHSYLNIEWHIFEDWVSNQNIKIFLVEGNHDIIPSYRFEKIGIEVVDELLIDNFLCTHHPTEVQNNMYNLCGHIHPGVQLKGAGKQYLKLPCFVQRPHQMILPAFGSFTGMHILSITAEDNIYVTVDDQVLELPSI